jgi:hypothetical protein
MLADESIEVRHVAAWNLVQWNDEKVMGKLRELSQTGDTTVAGVAACELADMAKEVVNLEAIHGYLRDELTKVGKPGYQGPGIVAEVIGLVGQHGDSTSIPLLRQAVRNVRLQKAAENATATIEDRLRKDAP